MKRLLLLLFVTCSCQFLLAQDEPIQDAAGCKDNPLFNRMPNTSIAECTNSYEEMEIPMSASKVEKKEGTRTTIMYNYDKEEANAPSFFQIVKNFENALMQKGGKKIYYNQEGGVATLFAKANGKDVWVVLHDGGGVKKGNFELITFEIEAMKQDITANEMLEAINKNGSVALQINFETGKSAIKSESQTIVDQIAEMLKSNPPLKVSVEGHTDNIGKPVANKTLSDNRAKAVVVALVAKGIDKSRLSSKGWGQEKPVADNSSEDGRAKNRRVEIVKM